MIRRSVSTLVLAGAILALPIAAQATSTPYPATEPELTCSATQVAPGEEFTCTITSEEGAESTLQATFAGEDIEIAGTTSATKPLVAGESVYTLTGPSVEGVIGLVASVDGEPFEDGEATVTVAAEMASTGFDSTGLAVGAAALLAGGAAVVFIAARRRSAQNA
jgi:hypothetical protein